MCRSGESAQFEACGSGIQAGCGHEEKVRKFAVYESNTAAILTISLKGGIGIIEGLNLSGVRPGAYDMLCLPVTISAGDGAPVRAVGTGRLEGGTLIS